MKKIKVDARGLACPEPVVRTKKALDETAEGEILVLADTENARDNIVRLAQSQGYAVAVAEETGHARITISKKAGSKPHADSAVTPCAAPEKQIVYLFDSDHIGSNRELGKVLINGFLNAALSLPDKNCTVILISNGVKLATKGSYALEVLGKLQEQGVRILICGTCLDFYKIRDKVQVGTISNALEIMQRMTSAHNTIKF
jgi:tRNA 2-thiouridine synthesizing protein A